MNGQPDFLDLKLDRKPSHFWIYKLHLDLLLLLGLAGLAVIAALVLYSASSQDVAVLLRQGTRLGLAVAVMFVLAQIHPRHYQLYGPLLFGVGVLLLGAVLVAGEIGKGAQRWLDLGILRFQPSELMKLATPMMLAWYLSENGLPPRFMTLLIAGVLIIVPTLLIAKQPDLGTALLVASSGSIVLFLAGISWGYLLLIAVLAGAALPVAWYFMHDYQRARVLTLLDPEADPLGRGYHIIQSKIAIGSGGLYGKGWLNGTQGQLEFLPERSTDFIFAVLAEEFGLLGCLGLIGVYLFILGRCLQIAMQAQTPFTRLLSGALTVTFFVYVFVNIGMVIGILPVVGVPLPLISYGGTSMVTLLAGFGILMSIHTHRTLLPG